METRLRQRLEQLRAEYEKGKKSIDELESQAGNVRATLLRISGAIQVLQEELGEAAPPAAPKELDVPKLLPERNANGKSRRAPA